MKDELVTFKTAKLAKEKDFNELCFDAYNRLGNKYSDGWCEYIDDNAIIIRNSELKISSYTAPTQSLLQKWLREIHNIILWVQPVTGVSGYEQYEFMYYIEQVDSNDGESGASKGMNWEETFEYGLQEALRLI